MGWPAVGFSEGQKCVEWPRCITFGGVVMGAERYSGQFFKKINENSKNSKTKNRQNKKSETQIMFWEFFVPGFSGETKVAGETRKIIPVRAWWRGTIFDFFVPGFSGESQI